jgi:hypothetical protein
MSKHASFTELGAVSKIEFRVTGAKEIEATMRELGAQAAGRIARSGLNKSGTVVVKRARELVPVDTGELRRSISKRLRLSGADRHSRTC